MAFAGIDPIDATDWQWVGAYRALEGLEDIRVVRTLLENTAKESRKQASRPSGMRRYGRRR